MHSFPDKSKIRRPILVLLAQHISLDDGGEFQSDEENSSDFEEDSDENENESETFHHENDEKRFPEYEFFYSLVNDVIKKSKLPETRSVYVVDAKTKRCGN